VPRANLVFGHLRGRNLPIATAVFAETLRRKLEAMRAVPGTSGSSNTLTHTLSLGESALNVVLTQPKSVACAE
jgi:hypothetical protein